MSYWSIMSINSLSLFLLLLLLLARQRTLVQFFLSLRRRTIYTLPTQSFEDNGTTYCCEVEADLYLCYRQYWYHRDNTNHRRFFLIEKIEKKGTKRKQKSYLSDNNYYYFDISPIKVIHLVSVLVRA